MVTIIEMQNGTNVPQNIAKLSAYEMRQLIRFGQMPERIDQFLYNFTNNNEF